MNIGETLKQKRIEKGLSFEEIYYHLKIKIDYLKQIEENNFQNLPEPPFVKVFIRSYGNFLGLDGDLLAKEFQKQILETKKTEGNIEIIKEKKEHNFIKKNRLTIILILVAIILVVFAVWKNFFLNKKISYNKKIVDSSNSSVETLKLINNEIKNSIDKNENIQKPDSTIVTKIENKINSHIIKIISIDTVWLTYKIDTLPSIEYFFRKNNIGDSITLKFKDSINFKIGNAAGLIIILEKDTIKNIGKKGQTTFLKIDSTFLKK